MAELVERHEVSVGVDPRTADLAAIESECLAAARRWADEIGISVDGQLSVVHRLPSHRDGPAVGVAWDVRIGSGGTDTSGWLWSARWRHWAGRFAEMMRTARAARNLSDADVGGAAVTHLDDWRGEVLTHDEWERRRATHDTDYDHPDRHNQEDDPT